MKKTSFLKFAMLTRFSRPANQRVIYRMIGKLRATNIVELGVQEGIGTQRMIESALRFAPAAEIHYTGIDLFESRPPRAPGLKLIEAHRDLKRLGVHVKLVPGDPFSALARTANSLTGTDLLVIRGDQDRDSLEQAWFYVPRMLHERSLVLYESAVDSPAGFEHIQPETIDQWATSRRVARRAA